MYELLKRYINSNISISPGKLEEIASLFRVKQVKRHVILLNAGEVCKELYFVNSGCIRTYYIGQDGRERTRYIAFDGIVGTALSSFISGTPSFEFVDATEDAELLCISRRDFYKLTDEMAEWGEFYRKLLELAYIYQSKRIESLVTLTARERFDEMMKNHPEYTRRLPNYILASYLDMSQETLSRLKKPTATRLSKVIF